MSEVTDTATTTLCRQHGLYSLIELWSWSMEIPKAVNVPFAALLSSEMTWTISGDGKVAYATSWIFRDGPNREIWCNFVMKTRWLVQPWRPRG